MTKPYVYIFPDTNIFLHFNFFTEIDWRKIVSAKLVTLVIAPVVMKELDRHKYNQSSERLRKRAGKVTKRFAELLTTNAEVRPGVHIQFERKEPQGEFEEFSLSRDSQDDHLIASVLAFQKNQEIATLITDDLSLRVKAHQLNVNHVVLPESYRIQYEEDPSKKKLQNLRPKYQALKTGFPLLRLQLWKTKPT